MRGFIAYDMYSQVVQSLRLIKERKRNYIYKINVIETCCVR